MAPVLFAGARREPEALQAVSREFGDAVGRMGWPFWSYRAPSDAGPGSSAVIAGYPPELVASYVARIGPDADDVVRTALARGSVQTTRTLAHASREAAALVRWVQAHGVIDEVAIPVRTGNGNRAVVTVGSDARVHDLAGYVREAGDALVWMGRWFHGTLEALARSEHHGSRCSPLSTREQECLRWVAAGKTYWETSKILGISERTVRYHVDNAKERLDTVNVTQATVEAVVRGYI